MAYSWELWCLFTQTLRSAFAALHMISVLYPSENIQSSIVKIDIYVFNYDIFVESDH